MKVKINVKFKDQKNTLVKQKKKKERECIFTDQNDFFFT